MNKVDFKLIDTPIEYKEINPNDFDSNYYTVEKEIIEPDEEGYINNKLIPLIRKSYNESNTVVINAGVGQGKTYSIVEIVSRYASFDEYIVIIAAPYKNLINQYVVDCSKDIEKSKIFDSTLLDFIKLNDNEEELELGYINDDEDFEKVQISEFKIHVMTINALLENAGEDNLFQKNIKRIYFEKLRETVTKSNKKIILILDEIHDGIYNFQNEFIYRLWNYQGLINKVFIVSATFNEASKEVIKYLSEFTNRKIQIIESKRTIIPHKQSNLHLVFQNNGSINRDGILVDLIADLTTKSKSFDILCYSKTQIEKLITPDKLNSTVGFYLNNIGNLNFCYSDIFDEFANQKYNANMVNIGTNFGTGVSINKENHTLIIILPKKTKIEYLNNKGIFNLGSIPIIQSLARQRKVGDIFVFLPRPIGLNPKSIPNYKDRESISKTFEVIKDPFSNKYVDYQNINTQKTTLIDTYKKLFNLAKTATLNIKEVDRTGMNWLKYPEIETFIIEKGEKFLSKDFFGGNLSVYTLWAALTNQFLNCKLKSIQSSKRVIIEEIQLYDTIKKMYIEFIDNSYYEELNFRLSDNISKGELYQLLNYYFFQFQDLMIGDKLIVKNKKTEVQIILLKLIINNEAFFQDYEDEKKGVLNYYIKSCIYHAYSLNIEDNNVRECYKNNIEIIEIYKEWSLFIDIIDKNSYELKKQKRVSNIIPDEFNILFSKTNMFDKIKKLIQNEYVVKGDVFQFKDTFKRYTSVAEMSKGFYKFLINNAFNGEYMRTNKAFYLLDNFNLKNQNLENLLYKELPEFIL